MTIPVEELERAELEQGAEDVLGVINHGMLALLVSVGHRTGLFDGLADLTAPTSLELAAQSHLDERYVREWLSAMVTGGLVDLDAREGRFSLPPARAAWLTHDAGPDNLASLAQFVSLLGGVEDEIVDCFHHGGGVPYSSYPKFQELMAEDSAQIHDALLVDQIIPLVEGLPEALRAGIDALDVGCGRGHAVNLLAEAFPRSRFEGIDIAVEALEVARSEARRRALANARFKAEDAATLGEPERYDLVTAFDAIHDQADPAAVLAGIHAALRPGGTFLCADIGASSDLQDNLDHPLGPFLYTISTMHCMTVSLAQDGAGLGTMWGEQKATAMLAEAGFQEVEARRLEDDIANVYYVARK